VLQYDHDVARVLAGVMCECVAACCSVLQYVAVWCNVLQCFDVGCTVLQYSKSRERYDDDMANLLAGFRCECVAMCCSVVQCVTVWCILSLCVVQCVAVRP